MSAPAPAPALTETIPATGTRLVYESRGGDRTVEFVSPDFPEGACKGRYEFFGDILVVRGFLPFASELVETANRVNVWSQSFQRNLKAEPYLGSARTSFDCALTASTHPDFARFDRLLTSVVGAAAGVYRGHNRFAPAGRTTQPFGLLRYRVGEHFRLHVDSRAQRELAARVVSFVGFLNDDFEGGELHFPRQELRLRPEAGSVVLFPSTYTHPHESCDVTSGTKFSVVNYLNYLSP